MGHSTAILDKNRQGLSWLIFGAWLVICITAFWQFQFTSQPKDDEELILFDASALQRVRLDESQQITVVHFIDPSCPCSLSSKSHIQELEERFHKQATFTQINPQQLEEPWATYITAADIQGTPSVGIWDDEGKLHYFGPHSSGAICGKGIDFVAVILNKLRQGPILPWINQQGIGCFCKTSTIS